MISFPFFFFLFFYFFCINIILVRASRTSLKNIYQMFCGEKLNLREERKSGFMNCTTVIESHILLILVLIVCYKMTKSVADE